MSDPKQISTKPEDVTTTRPDRVSLQVGERHFVTTKDTLEESHFFCRYLSGRWDDNANPDGTFFVDADGDLFEHILRYLRRKVLPIFFNMVQGHDLARYLALLEEARYYQIDRLQKWLEDQDYLKAVQVRDHIEIVQGAHSSRPIESSSIKTDYHPYWTVKKVYVCPRGIVVHRGNRSACGRACQTAQGDDSIEYEDQTELETLIVRRELNLENELCLKGREECL